VRPAGVLALGQIREPAAVPRIGPVGLELRRPFELSRRVVVMRLVIGDLTQPVRDEPQPEVNQRIVAVLLRHLDRRSLQALQRQRVGHARERVAQRLDRGAVGPGLGGKTGGGTDEQSQ